ncbi:tetratricopeptide repeat protein [Paraferrimonas sedimenticola]|uniref:Tetratricopeptide repeat-containing protein n=1 Tax=Paraferrimonas sedimenticola TaxID=375674 RepID=A0AA37RUQ1_9GAMM|nr:tetratricopeptide repeat protein [Paraferrimonas sedimenticola]GLP95644.1 hypothetical protein GCM10007895_09500 [Paraferrimonas sedimenticola]
MQKTLFLLLLALLTGCATAPAVQDSMVVPFVDSAFTQEIPPPDRQQALHLTSEQSIQLKHAFSRDRKKLLAHEWLAQELSAKSGKFTYRDRLSALPNETYQAREGNCLSLVLLTSAMARELGVEVVYREVKVEPVWDRDSGYLLINDHINIELKPERRANTVLTSTQSYVVDFLPQRAIQGYRVNHINERELLSMLYNNLAAERLIDGELDAAYWLAKASLEQDPTFLPAVNTLALIYRRKGLEKDAEAAYRFAMAHDPKDLTSLNNFAVLLADQGRLEEWAQIHRTVELTRLRNPYHYFDQAEAALAAQNYELAIHFYQKALDRADYRHEFHYGLAKAYAQSGEIARAKNSLDRALKFASSDSANKKRYQSKLAAFSAFE